MVLGAICGLLLGAISLDGVIGERLTADAAFDAGLQDRRHSGKYNRA